MGCSSSSNARFACSNQSLSSQATNARGDTFTCIRRPSAGPHVRCIYSVLRGAVHNRASEGGSAVVTCDFSVRFFDLLQPSEIVRGATPPHQVQVTAISVSRGQLTIRLPSATTSVTFVIFVTPLSSPVSSLAQRWGVCQRMRGLRVRAPPRRFLLLSGV